MAASLTYANILKYGTQAAYDALSTKDSSVLYFCTDTKKIYKGTVDFTDSVVFADAKPTSPIVGKLYILADDGTAQVYNGSAWTVVSYPIATSISSTSDDVHVVSPKAVYSYVQDITGGATVVKEVSVSDTEGKIKVTKGNDTSSDVAVHGVVTTPTWDSSSRKLTLPIVDGDDVVVDIGKDIFIDPNGNNRYEGGYIYLYLNDGTSTKASTELKIPVTGLITDYFGDATNTVKVTVDASTHKVTADVVVRPDDATTSFTNAIKVSSTEGAKGLYVDLSGIEGEIDELESAVSLGASYNAANSAAASNAAASASTANSYAAANSAAIDAAKSTAKSYGDANSAAISTNKSLADSTDAVISASASTANSYAAANSAAISGEVVRAKAAESTEVARAESAEAVLTAAASTANSYAAANSAAISTEVVRAKAAESTNAKAASTANSYAAANSAAISGEVARATSAETVNAAAASTAQAAAESAGSYAKSYGDANSAAASTANSYAAANSAAVSTEVVRATSAEAVNAAAASTANSYAAANSAALSTEVARATSAESTNAAYAKSYGDANSAAASTAKSAADQNAENLSALAVAVGWGTF